MKYTVRNEDGSLDFQSLGEVAEAYRNGLIEESDELLEPGKTAWRKIGAIAALTNIRPKPATPLFSPIVRMLLLTLSGSAFALWRWLKGDAIGGGVAALVVALITLQFSAAAVRRGKKQP